MQTVDERIIECLEAHRADSPDVWVAHLQMLWGTEPVTVGELRGIAQRLGLTLSAQAERPGDPRQQIARPGSRGRERDP